MEAKKAVKIRAQELDVANLSQVRSYKYPQGEAVDAKQSLSPFMQDKSADQTIKKIRTDQHGGTSSSIVPISCQNGFSTPRW
jgi:hypothetical protein